MEQFIVRKTLLTKVVLRMVNEYKLGCIKSHQSLSVSPSPSPSLSTILGDCAFEDVAVTEGDTIDIGCESWLVVYITLLCLVLTQFTVIMQHL